MHSPVSRSRHVNRERERALAVKHFHAQRPGGSKKCETEKAD